jgi:hypothetical protein
MMGKKLIEGTLPDIAHQLKRIADALENKQQDQVTSAFKSYVHSGATDSDIVKQLREIWQK